MASCSSFLRSSALVFACTDSSVPGPVPVPVPVPDESTSASHYSHQPSVVSSRWLEALQRNRIGDLSLFFSVAATKRSLTEQGQGSREGVGATEFCVSPEILL